MDQAFFDSDGYLAEPGLDLLIELLANVRPHNHGKAFVPLVKALGLVPAGVEIILVDNHQVYLTHRDDEHFTGWHTPGGYLHQREEYADAANRVAQRELGCSVEVVRELATVSHVGTPRFHDVSILLLCKIADQEPQGGEWFAACPPDLLDVQAMYWPHIQQALGGTP